MIIRRIWTPLLVLSAMTLFIARGYFLNSAVSKRFMLARIKNISRLLVESDDRIKIDRNVLIENFFKTSEVPRKEDVECIEARQLGQSADGIIAVSTRCKHGFPQAFVRYPVGRGMSSGMVRLSCPYLVKEIDEWEKSGAIAEFNERMAFDDDLKGKYMKINATWRIIREESLTPEERKDVELRLGGEASANFLSSGFIGVTVDKVDDVKCLHAHVADALLRGRGADGNVIGDIALKKLEAKGVDVTGCAGNVCTYCTL